MRRRDEPTRIAHRGDKWFAERTPDIVVFAETTDQVSRLLQFASAHRIPVTARGAGYGYVGSCVPVKGGIALSFARMKRIKEIHAGDAIAIVEPGVITGVCCRSAFARRSFFIRLIRPVCMTARSVEMWPQTRVARVALNMALLAITSSDSKWCWPAVRSSAPAGGSIKTRPAST